MNRRSTKIKCRQRQKKRSGISIQAKGMIEVMSVQLHSIEIVNLSNVSLNPLQTFALIVKHVKCGTTKQGEQDCPTINQNKLESMQLVEFLYHFSYSIEYTVANFFSHCVVTPGIVVGRIFLSCNELVWMEQLSVSSCFHFI